MQAALGGKLSCMLARLLKVAAVLDQRGAERSHGGVLLDRVAVRHDDRGGDAVAGGRQRDRLAVVAAGGADHTVEPGLAPHQFVQVDRAAAQLERADAAMVLVLDPGPCPEPGIEQRPAQGGRRWLHHGDDGAGSGDFFGAEKLHAVSGITVEMKG